MHTQGEVMCLVPLTNSSADIFLPPSWVPWTVWPDCRVWGREPQTHCRWHPCGLVDGSEASLKNNTKRNNSEQSTILLKYYPKTNTNLGNLPKGSGDSSVVRVLDSWLNGLRFKSWQGWQENFLPQGLLFLCWLSFRYLFHVCVITVACKRSWSFCQKCRWQVTTKHTCTLFMWLCRKWHDMVHGCMVYTECAKMAAVSHGTSHVTIKQHCKHTILVDIQKHNTFLKS